MYNICSIILKYKHRIMKKFYKRGFTLVELLVVIAIVGILSAVVLGQLRTSRAKGIDGSIKATMNSAASAAQLYYDIHNNSSWNSVCTASNGLGPIETRLDQTNGNTTICNGQGQNGWMLASPLTEQVGKYWCVDHLSTKKICNAAPTGYTCAAGC